MNTLKIRQASIKDLHEVAHLFDQYRQFYKQAPDVTLAISFISDRIKHQQSVILVAEDEEKKVAGFCQLYPTFCSVAAAPIAVLYDLFVAQNARKMGAGRALMLAASNYAKQNGFVRLELSTAKTNVNAQALYESLGWQRDAIFYYYSLETNQ